MRYIFAATIFALSGILSPAISAQTASGNSGLAADIAGPWRTPRYVARDSARHPVEELEFFGIKPDMTVVEIWPTGGYWTEILAPYLRDRGTYYAAVSPAGVGEKEMQADEAFKARFSDQAIYGAIKYTEFAEDHYDIAPPNSADMVLTFRNVHNWMPRWTDAAFASFFKALKPGGILGVEEHRGRDDSPQDPNAKSGYVRQDYMIELARKAGFVFVSSSEVGANPKDTKDYVGGVWTLPPTLALGDKDRAKYTAIGDADNAVLKFRKP